MMTLGNFLLPMLFSSQKQHIKVSISQLATLSRSLPCPQSKQVPIRHPASDKTVPRYFLELKVPMSKAPPTFLG
jgi:hypothetical protein